jgi:hypothetical protein
MPDNRNASSKAIGYYYQGNYYVYYFIDDDVKSIIQEGDNYEDITINCKNGTSKTIQVKHHTSGKQNLNYSNNDFAKVLANYYENNKLDKIIYLCSRYGDNTYDSFFTNWMNKGITTSEILDKIMTLKSGSTSNSSHKFDEFYKIVEDIGRDKAIEYLDKFEIQIGLKYKELSTEIISKIKSKFNVDDIHAIFIKYSITESNNNKWSLNTNNNKNKYTDTHTYLDKIISKLKTSNGDIKKNNITLECLRKCIDDLKNLYFYDTNDIIYNIDFTDLTCILKTDNLFDISIYLEILLILHYIYNKINNQPNNNDSIKNIQSFYKIVCYELTSSLLEKYKKFDKTLDKNNLKEICKSISYYDRHDIKNMINLSKCYLGKIGIISQEEYDKILKMYDQLKKNLTMTIK